MPEIVSFDEAIRMSDRFGLRHLLLGNGFSIARFPTIFNYQSLFKAADFNDKTHLITLFEDNKTYDFEAVIKILIEFKKIAKLYDLVDGIKSKNIDDDIEHIKNILVQSIASSHPDHPNVIEDDEYISCGKFLNKFLTKRIDGNRFSKIYSLNYDLLLYWTLMRCTELASNPEKKFLMAEVKDGFSSSGIPNDRTVVFTGEKTGFFQNIHYLHGALHIFDVPRDNTIVKRTWVRTDERLIDQTRALLDDDKYPLFVAEGEHQSKFRKIRQSPYLYSSYEQFFRDVRIPQAETTCLFIYGHSCAANDDHILRHIFSGRLVHVFISVYGGFGDANNIELIKNITKYRKYNSQITVTYFDAESASIWNQGT